MVRDVFPRSLTPAPLAPRPAAPRDLHPLARLGGSGGESTLSRTRQLAELPLSVAAAAHLARRHHEHDAILERMRQTNAAHLREINTAARQLTPRS